MLSFQWWTNGPRKNKIQTHTFFLPLLYQFSENVVQCFWTSSPPSPAPPRSTLHSPPTQLCVYIKYILCCSSTLGCVAFPLSMVKLPLATPSFARIYQLPIALSCGWDFVSIFPLHVELVWLELAQVLCMLLQLLWVHMNSCPDASKEHCFLVVSHHLLQSFFASFHMIPEP